jgi:hypothetical protein
MNGSKSHETSPLSKCEMRSTNPIPSGDDNSVRILPNAVGQASKIPLQKVAAGPSAGTAGLSIIDSTIVALRSTKSLQ